MKCTPCQEYFNGICVYVNNDAFMKHYFSDRHDIGEADFGKIMEITEVDPIKND